MTGVMTRGALLGGTTAILLAAPAAASPDFNTRETNRGTEADIVTGPFNDEPRVERSAGSSDGRLWLGIPRVGAMENESGDTVYCRDLQWVRVTPEERAQRARDAESDFLFLYQALPELHGSNPGLECPVEPGEDVPPVVLREAITHTIRDDLPRPELEVPPGYALTGMPAFLVTNHALEYGPVTHTVDLGVTVLDVTVTATGSTHVDWGDGHAQTYDAPGTAWPHGQVVHTYRDTGHVDITVTDTWQVTYRVPSLGIEDSVEAALPARTLEGLEIQQVQAVRVSD
jgi:hypothetical protein